MKGDAEMRRRTGNTIKKEKASTNTDLEGSTNTEKELYEPVKEALQTLIKSIFPNKEVHLEVTAEKGFSNRLKSQIPDYREIVFQFLKDVRPDITGFIKQDYGSEIIVVEVKDEMIKLDHIYQIKKYAELLDAKYALLVSTHEIPDEIKRLCKRISVLSLSTSYNKIRLIYYDKEKNQFKEWFEEMPF